MLSEISTLIAIAVPVWWAAVVVTRSQLVLRDLVRRVQRIERRIGIDVDVDDPPPVPASPPIPVRVLR